MQHFFPVDKVTNWWSDLEHLPNGNGTMTMQLCVITLTFTVPALGQSPRQTILMLNMKVLVSEAQPTSSRGSLDQRLTLNGAASFKREFLSKYQRQRAGSKISGIPRFVWFKAPLQMKMKESRKPEMIFYSKP